MRESSLNVQIAILELFELFVRRDNAPHCSEIAQSRLAVHLDTIAERLRELEQPRQREPPLALLPLLDSLVIMYARPPG